MGLWSGEQKATQLKTMLEIIKQKPLIAGIGITFLIGTFIGIVLFFTIFTKYAGASDGNRVGNHFMLATGGTSVLSVWDWKIEGENWEEIQPLTLSEANNLGWEKEVTCVPNVGYYSRRAAANDFAEPYSLIFDNQDMVIGIYLFSENQQQSPWEQMQATGPFPYPHWGLHIFFKNPSTAC